MTHVFIWGNNAKRATLKGRSCRIVASGRMRSCLVEFDDGQREIVDFYALRLRKDEDFPPFPVGPIINSEMANQMRLAMTARGLPTE